MNLLFVSNGSLTPVYAVVAKHLESLGHNIFWIVSEDKWRESLSYSFSPNSILRIARTLDYDLTKPSNVSIPLNEIIFIDRELKYWKSDLSSLYICNLHHKIKDFLLSNKINFTFCENTWAHEIIISMMCDFDDEIDCLNFSPANLRIPDNRFAFFSNFLLNETKDRRHSLDKVPSNFFENRSEIRKQDDIIVKKRKSKSVWAKKLVSFIIRPDYDEKSPTCWGTSRINSFKRNMKQLFNAFSYRFVSKIGSEQILKLSEEKQLYIYAFHKEPETSINNKGRYYENQAQCIINIWRKLPVGSVLLIKEHRVSIGDRGYFYFKKLLKLGSIRVVDENVDSAYLLQKCDACFTVSGTMAYEFALYQKPAFTFAKVFFNSLKYCSELSISELTKGDDMNSIIKRLIMDKPGLSNEEYATQLSDLSYPGRIDDTTDQPGVMDSSNIDNLCTAFAEHIESHAEK